MILYEHFDKNEIFIIIELVVGYGAFFLFPKKLPRDITLLFLLWGFTTATFFDFTIGGGLIDFYKVNDSNHYELFDLLTYISFSNFGYFFVYFYERFKINKRTFIIYVLGWTIIGMVLERVTLWFGVIHYQHGYTQFNSLITFLIVQTTTGLFYELIKTRRILEEN